MTTYPRANLDTTFFAVLVGYKHNQNALEARALGYGIPAIVRDIRAGEYHRVIAVFAFNPVEGWSQDISTEVAQAVLDGHEGDDSWSLSALNFVESSLPGVFIRRAA